MGTGSGGDTWDLGTWGMGMGMRDMGMGTWDMLAWGHGHGDMGLVGTGTKGWGHKSTWGTMERRVWGCRRTWDMEGH